MKYTNKSFLIACDGGAATGKSTGAKMVAKKFRLKFLSSGLLYRYASYLILKHKPKNKISFLKKKFEKLKYKKLNNYNLHTEKISIYTSEIAKILKVRKILKSYQKKFAKTNKYCVIEGRDISQIFPKSDIKFFFICSIEIAALRRFKELKRINKKINFNDVKIALKARNLADTKRRFNALRRHPESVYVDTGKLNKQAMLSKMSRYIEKKI